MTKLKGTGRRYKPMSMVWVLVYLVYMIGMITLTGLFTFGWILFF